MRHDLKRNSNSTIELEVELSHEEMKIHLARAVESLTREKPIEGFRPGKAPYEIATKHFGEMKIYERALGDAINAVVPGILDDEGVQVVGRPEVSVKKIAPQNPVVFSLASAIVPEFTLPDIELIAKKVLRERKTVNVEKKEVDETLEWLRNARAGKRAVDRPAEKGDAVEIDFTALYENTAVGGGPSKNHPLVVGEGSMIPGFEDELIGMRVGDEKKFSLQVPESHKEPSIAGKTLDFTVRMALVEERVLPELNDEFAKNVGNFPDLVALRANITKGILEEKEIKERDRVRVAIMDAIAKEIRVTIPEVIIESELEKMTSELRENIASMNLPYEDYLQHIKKTDSDLKKEWRPEAERRVIIALILRAIAKKKSIQPSDSEVEAEIHRLLSRFKSADEAKKEIDSAALESYARGVIRNEKVFQYLESLA